MEQQKESGKSKANRQRKEDLEADMDKLKCFYTNATSLNFDQLSELSTYAASEDPHCVFITETWFTDTSIPQLDNYILFKHDRNGHGEA